MRSAASLVWFLLILPAIATLATAEPPPPPATARHARLLQAIAERRVVTFHYDGRRRIVEPHAYGQSRKGNALLRGYEISRTEGEPPVRQAGRCSRWKR